MNTFCELGDGDYFGLIVRTEDHCSVDAFEILLEEKGKNVSIKV